MSYTPYTINSITSVFKMIDCVREEVFATIQHEQEGELSDADFQEMAYDLLRAESDNFSSNCGSMCAKKFVEEYGVFQALKKAEEHGYSLKDLQEDTFYKYLLTIILFLSDEAYDTATSIQSYNEYCEANPLED